MLSEGGSPLSSLYSSNGLLLVRVVIYTLQPHRTSKFWMLTWLFEAHRRIGGRGIPDEYPYFWQDVLFCLTGMCNCSLVCSEEGSEGQDNSRAEGSAAFCPERATTGGAGETSRGDDRQTGWGENPRQRTKGTGETQGRYIQAQERLNVGIY